MEASYEAATETFNEVSAKNAGFKKVCDGTVVFRGDASLWWQVAEYGYDSFMVAAAPKCRRLKTATDMLHARGGRPKAGPPLVVGSRAGREGSGVRLWSRRLDAGFGLQERSLSHYAPPEGGGTGARSTGPARKQPEG